MKRLSNFGAVLALAAIALCLGWSSPALAQTSEQAVGDLFPNLSFNRYGQSGPGGLSDDNPSAWTANAYSLSQSDQLLVAVTVKLAPTWHVYSLTQPKGGPLPTRLSIKGLENEGLKWQSDKPAKKSISEQFAGVTIEEHDGATTFFTVVSLPAGVSSDQWLPLEVQVDALACTSSGACLPIDETVQAELSGAAEDEVPSLVAMLPTNEMVDVKSKNLAKSVDGAAKVDPTGTVFRDEDYAVQWQATLLTTKLAPGQQTELVFVATPDKGYHVYPAAVDDSQKSTNFVVTDKGSLRVGKPKTTAKIIRNEPFPGIVDEYHQGLVTWKVPIEVPADAAAGETTIQGAIAYQACTDKNCLLPSALEFSTTIEVADSADKRDDQPQAIQLVSAEPGKVLKAAAATKWVDDVQVPKAEVEASETPAPSSKSAESEPADEPLLAANGLMDNETLDNGSAGAVSLPTMFGLAFLGGVILNFMPCVLPVVGLKVMSFVQQAGEHPRRVLWLNLVYTLGILSVFAVLAGLAVLIGFSWGEQFTYFPVRLSLTLLLFALALSYLGVWEIPVPGMAAGKVSGELQSQEGYTGAFFKGVFATILATPCSGPLLGYILGLTLGLSSQETFAVIMTVGLGMAIPYVLIGLRPSLVNFLPKPGTWMETLKEFLAFLFLGTVAFFFAGFSEEHRVPVFVALIGVWFGCWIIGQVPSWQTLGRRLTAWVGGIAVATVIGIAAFAYLVPGEKVLAWEPYNEARLQQLQSEGKTVLVDFSAKWCVNCIVNLNVAIDTKPTAELVDELNAVALYADWTDRDPEIKAKLAELQSRSIPLLAIYPGKNPEQPIVLRDLVSQNAVLEALKQAGPSVSRNAQRSLARAGIPEHDQR